MHTPPELFFRHVLSLTAVPVLQQLLTGLIELRTTRTHEWLGICDNLQYKVVSNTDSSRVLNSAFQAWPKFSGTVMYPVPSEVTSVLHPTTIFNAHKRANKSMWDVNTTYGALRHELLEFIITSIEVELALRTSATATNSQD